MQTPRVGRRFGKLVVVERVEVSPHDGNNKYRCVCDCGGERVTRWKNLSGGKTVSCGCARIAGLHIGPLTIHSDAGSRHPLYNTWRMMLHRCYDPDHHKYRFYGARGVVVCDEWRNSLLAFARDVGERPQKTTLDRIDPSGNYEPANCRWATKLEQHTNTRQPVCRTITIRGKSALTAEWARKLGIGTDKITAQIKRGVAPDVAVIAVWLRKLEWERKSFAYDTCLGRAEMMVAAWNLCTAP